MRNIVCAKDVFVKAFGFFFLEEIDGTLNPSLNWSSFLTVFRYYISGWGVFMVGGCIKRYQNVCLRMETSALYHFFIYPRALIEQ